MLARLRAAAGLTQEELAERSGLSARGIGNLERGTGRPRMLTMERLAAGLVLNAAGYEELSAAARRSCRTGPGEGPTTAVARRDLLVGREEEVALLRRHVLGAESAGLALVGEVGLGKSRLLAEAAAIAAEEEVVVLAGGCQKFGGDPYAPLVGALADYVRRTPAQVLRGQLNGCERLDQLLPEIVGLAPAGWGEVGEQRRRLMFAATRRFLLNISGPRGVVLLLDDLQWAGADGVVLIDSVLRDLAPGHVRVVLAYRDTEAPDGAALAATVAELHRAGLLARRQLRPLAEHEAEQLLEQCQPFARERALAMAGGVPLHLVQLGAAGGELPWGLSAVVRQQLAELPKRTISLLELLALADRPMALEPLSAVSGLRDETVVRLLTPALAARVARETAAGVELATGLLREVLVQGLSGAQREVLGRRVFEQLTATW
ncbi:hypothetical protein GCM10010174_15410 [Kutzneria viridogrisea]|uniref:HTH cro/C1-type domain-containing protein n=1 Tax=Kutzneria albida DSM 43870 TaxID=1449976 RepID=W5WI09_9PSEU|nr:hypothetical protein KALB_7476 [Kutzneria albida DSM 43870]